MVNGRQPRLEPTDDELAQAVAERDVAAFGLLYDRYARPVYALAAHLLGPAEAEESVQEIFLRLWHKAGQFDPHRGSFAAWFMTIARHRVLADLAARGRQRRFAAGDEIDQILAQTSDPSVDIEEEVALRERGAAAWRAVAALPPEQRRVIILAYFGDLSQSTIARDLDLPLGTVKKRLRLGLQKLRAALLDPGQTTGAETRPGESAPERASTRMTHEL